MTIVEIKDNKIYLNGDVSEADISDFDLDKGLGACKLSDFRNKHKPILKKLFGQSPVYTNIKINTDMCLYYIREVILSISSISEKIKISIHYSSSHSEESFFKTINHDDILRLRYINLFESILNKRFKFNVDLFYYILYGYCYHNLMISSNPSSNSYESFMDQSGGLLDVKSLNRDFYLDRVGVCDNFDLFEVNHNTIFPSQNTIQKHGWISGGFYEYFSRVRSLIVKELNVNINNHLQCFDPMVDKNFQFIMEEVLSKQYGKS